MIYLRANSRQITALISRQTVRVAYGQTELGGLTWNSATKDATSLGKILPGCKIKV